MTRSGKKRRLLRGSDMIAKRIGCSRRTVYTYTRDHDLPAFKLGGADSTSPLCCYEDELNRWLDERPSTEEETDDGS